MRWQRDLVSGVIMLIVSISVYIMSNSIRTTPFAQGLARTSVYVQLWMILLAVLSLCLIIKALKVRDTEKVKPILTPVSILTVAAIALYIIIMPILGFTLTTTAFLFITITAYTFYPKDNRLKGKKLVTALVKYLALSVVFTIVVQQIFVRLLSCVLP